jgi:transposase
VRVGLCALHGIYHYERLWSDRTKRLEQLRISDGRELPPRIKAEIRRELQRLEVVLQMIEAIEKERNVMALGKAPTTYGNAKKVQQLAKIGSIGPEIARYWPVKSSTVSSTTAGRSGATWA